PAGHGEPRQADLLSRSRRLPVLDDVQDPSGVSRLGARQSRRGACRESGAGRSGDEAVGESGAAAHAGVALAIPRRRVAQKGEHVNLSDFITESALRRLVEHALDEDLGRGDVTSDLLVPSGVDARAAVRSRGEGVVAGLDVAALVFEAADPRVKFTALTADGSTVARGQDVAVVSGAARGVLRGERVALNFLQRLSGVATLTARYVEAIRGSRARIIDTRKTTPGLRAIEKYAVRAGGGFNHRRDLSDAMLIKDNHLAAIAARGLSLTDAVKQARASMPHTLKVEIEVDRLDQVPEALAAGADIILLDNM